jgi:hypothetical protein
VLRQWSVICLSCAGLLCGLIGPSQSRAEGPLFSWNGQEVPIPGPDLNEPLATDRPDFTEASSTVGLGVLQLESGYTYLRDESDGLLAEGHSVGELLFRYGIVDDWLELRFNINPVSVRAEMAGFSASTTGTEDITLGFKTWLTAQDGWRPEASVITALSLPTGSNAFTANEVQPTVNFLYGWDINDIFSTAGSTGFTRVTDDLSHDYLELHQSWTVGVTFTEQWGGYAEWFCLVPNSAIDAKTEHYIDGGLTYKLTKDVQFDVRAGYGLNDAAADMFAGVGLSIRWP